MARFFIDFDLDLDLELDLDLNVELNVALLTEWLGGFSSDNNRLTKSISTFLFVSVTLSITAFIMGLYVPISIINLIVLMQSFLSVFGLLKLGLLPENVKSIKYI